MRPATKHDLKYLGKMPPYARMRIHYIGKITFPLYEDIFVAENDGEVLGAISFGHRNITFVPKELKEGCEQRRHSEMEEVSGCWISKLYVFPEHRCRGTGTKLVKETVEWLQERGLTEVYAGINVNNKFNEVSQRVFGRNNFETLGSCFCFSSRGNCQGTLLRKTIRSTERARIK